MVDKKMREKEKFELCKVSGKANTNYCQDCKESFCKDCLKEHSGHRFTPICLAVSKLSTAVAQVETKVGEVQGGLKLQVLKVEKSLREFETAKTDKLRQVDEFFDQILFKVAEARDTVKAEFEEKCASKHSHLTVCLAEYKKYLVKLEQARIKVTKVADEVSNIHSLRGH